MRARPVPLTISFSEGDGIGGDRIAGADHKVRSFASGRMCAEPGCTTRLSIYNSRPRCSLHDFDARMTHPAVHHEAPEAKPLQLRRPGRRIARKPAA